MNQKINYSVKPSIMLFTLTLLGLIFLIITGVQLANTKLVAFNNDGETEIIIAENQEYYVLLNTSGVREEIKLNYYSGINYIEIEDEDEHSTFLSLVTIPSATSNLEIQEIEFDKQIRKKNHLSFGTVELKEGTYKFESLNTVSDNEIGDFALLATDYVNHIGLFSISAIFTFTFALLGFKSYRKHQSKPLSKYMLKHVNTPPLN